MFDKVINSDSRWVLAFSTSFDVLRFPGENKLHRLLKQAITLRARLPVRPSLLIGRWRDRNELRLWPGPLPVREEWASFKLSRGDVPADLGRPGYFSISAKMHRGWLESLEPRSCLWFSDENLILVGRATGLGVGGTQKQNSCLKGVGKKFFGLLFPSQEPNPPAPGMIGMRQGLL